MSLVFILLVNTTNLTFPNAVDEKTIKDWRNTIQVSSLHEEAESKQSDYDIKNFWRELEQDEVDELCDASEDYEKFKKGCDAAYESIVTPEEYEKEKAAQ